MNLSDLATVVAAVAAVGAGIAAWQSSWAAASLAAIERHRWHADLTPQFTVNCRANGGTGRSSRWRCWGRQDWIVSTR